MNIDKNLNGYFEGIDFDLSSSVYYISEDYVAKVVPMPKLFRKLFFPQNSGFNGRYCEEISERGFHKKSDLLNHEFKMLDKAYRHGLNVPKPKGIYEIKANKNSSYLSKILNGKNVPALVMERINGIYWKDVHDLDQWTEAKAQFSSEIYKAKNLGFNIEDHDFYGNSLWSSKENKIYLLDLELWDHPQNENQ